MNENNEFLSKITLEYLMNKEQYAKYVEQNKPANKLKYQKEKKFYKKRIYDFTKKMLNEEKIENKTPDMNFTFENYICSCIEYFKMLDKTDILQEDYANITNTNLINIKVESVDEANKSMMRFVKMHEPNSLEKIVKRTVIKSAAVPNPSLPKQKNINLKDPILRNKGICKKNNISNKYEDATTTTPPI